MIGTNTVLWTATDEHNNVNTCTQLVVVNDAQPPTITAPPALADVPTDSGKCYATSVTLGTPVANDNCGVLTVTNDAPAQFQKGDTTVIWTVVDNSGNTATATQIVTVKDHELPTITAPAALADVSTDSGKCYATSVNLGAPQTHDNCAVLTATNDAPAQFQKGDTTVTWTVVDTSGNIATATQVVTVKDHELPTITAPAALADVHTEAGQCYATNVSLGTPTTADNCGVAIVTNNAPAQFAKGDTTVIWTVVDTSGNIATATQLVTVQDHEPPTITAPAALADVHTDAGQCFATSVNLGVPSATNDNCGLLTVTNNAPAQFPKGDTTVTWTAVDSSGNTATATQVVTVKDHEPPTITAPAALADVATALGQCYATNVNLGAPLATNDNCALLTVTNDAPAQFPKGDTTVTWTAVDTSGNMTTATQVVTVKDHELPTITAPAVVTINADAGKCYATGVTLGSPTTADNCGVATVTNDAPSQFPVGNTTVTWTVTDTSGNVASAPQTVTVNDNQNPTVTCPADITVYTTNATGIAVTFSPSADDNCGIQSLVANPASGSNFPIGSTTVTVTATDIHGNTNQCSFTVTVILDHAPVAGSINLGAVANHPRTLLLDKVLGEASDQDTDTLTIVAVTANSTNGGTVTLTETNIVYTPATNFVGADLFTYTISDGHTGSAIGSVLVTVLSENAASLNLVGQPTPTNGTVVVRFAGIPGITYSVERSSDQVTWTSAGTYTVPNTGIAEFTDSTPAAQPPYYYRTALQ
jgi:hypothetical protein